MDQEPVVDGRLLARGIAIVSVFLSISGVRVSAGGDAVGVGDKPATIIIRSMRETGTYVNERPRLEFELLVQPDGMVSYEVTKRATVPFTAMGSLRVGDGFRAKVAGADEPTRMEIDWSAPMPGGDDDGVGADRKATGQDTETRLAKLDELRQRGSITEEEYDIQRRRILDTL